MSGVEESLERFKSSVLDHLAGFGDALDVAAMRGLVRSRAHRSLVEVPAKYVTAYRLTWGVPGEDLRRVVRAPLARRAFDVPGRHRVAPGRVRSWTVSLESLSSESRTFVPEDVAEATPTDLGGYAVLASCLIRHGARRRVFWLNPDEVYRAVGREEFAHEREVASVGPVGAVSVSYVRQSHGGRKTWGQLMDVLVRHAARS